MTVPTIFEGISDQPEATSLDGLFFAAESANPSDPTVKVSLDLIRDLYRGLWPETGGSASKGEIWQVQSGGTPTGEYFSALKDTIVDPVGDNVNWREVISDQSIGGVASYQASSIANMIDGITERSVIAPKIPQYWTVSSMQWERVGLSNTASSFKLISSPLNETNFDNVDELKSATVSDGYLIDFESLAASKAKVSVNNYHSGWAATERGAVSIQGNILKASDYTGTPDGFGDFYVGGGTDYVFKLRYKNKTKIEWFGARGSFDSLDAPHVKAAFEHSSPELVIDGEYVFDAMTIPSKKKIKGTGNAKLKLVTGFSVSSGAIIQAATTERVVIDGVDFEGLGASIGNSYNMISANESNRFKFTNGDFIRAHGVCLRLNKANRAKVDNVDFSEITGENLNPGEGVYALGLINSTLTNLSGTDIGDHLLYLQGEDEFDFRELRNNRIEHIYAEKTGQNGLTGGAAIVLYNRNTDNTLSNITTKDCPVGIQISTKPNYTGQATLRISITDVINSGSISRGLFVKTDASDNTEHKEVTLSNVRTIACQGAWGHDLTNIVGLYIDPLCIAGAGSGGGLSMVDCRKGTLTGGNYSDNQNGYGIFTSNLEDFNLVGWISRQNYRAGLALSGNPVRVHASLGANIPPSGVNDTFIISDTAVACVIFGMTPRDLGNVVGSAVWGNSPPSEGAWSKGDIMWNSRFDGTNPEKWRCTVSGAPGTWIAV